MEQIQDITEQLEKEAERLQRVEKIVDVVEAQEEEAYDDLSGEKLKLIPTPNFTDCKSVGTMLPINMANEIVTNIAKISAEVDLVEFVREKLDYSSRIKVCQSYSSEQIDALVLAIKSFEKGNGFILGDMAGIGKGRICAGVLRYAQVNGMIPVFMTQKPYLLNDIYRDLMNVDGIGVDKKGKALSPKPFVMHCEGVVIDRDGNPIPTAQLYKTTYKDGEPIYRFLDKGAPDTINEICKQITDDIERTGNVKLNKNFNCVMLPYSVISQSRSTVRRDFLNAIAPNAIFVFDESHNAASANLNSNILRVGLPLVQACKAVLFSSATYAKTPSVFNLYVVKTALRTAVPSLDNITNALKVGGENVSEYIATGLVTEGQMIRRERSFGDCKKITEFVGRTRVQDELGQTIYRDLTDDTQRAFYDEAIGYFKELRDFSKSDMANAAIKSAIDRKVAAMKKNLADTKEYDNASKAKDDFPRQQFIQQNKGKYILSYTTDSISRYKATFRENLFLAIKAKFAADKIIECLNNPITYKNIDGQTYEAPMKPIIAIANTGEAVFDELRLEEGQEVVNDFSVYLKALYYKMFAGTFRLRKVDSNIFESRSTLIANGIDFDEIDADYIVELSDFADDGLRITDIQNKLDKYKSSLPFSVIDYLRDRIESVERSPVYFSNQVAKSGPLYGMASSTFYKFAEGTSRKYMLKRENGVLIFKKNDRIKSTTRVFRAFNDGAVDVMLINVVASTGGSAQSSPAEGIDTRPRNMFIVQFELDINIEVQKRGRINRTGQLNSPTYTYIISQIPVELRKYLMFRKKLRKLDANTSADQTASAKTAEMTDAKGNPIEDIFNHYGFEVFKTDFIELPSYVAYNAIFNGLSFREKSVSQSNTAEKDEVNVAHFDAFVRELELYPSKFQERFFDVMNEKYIEKKRLLKLQGEWQEELEAQNYKASLKQQVLTQLNSGSTVFSRPLFIADYYTLESRKPWSKDKVVQRMSELATFEGKAMTPDEFYVKFIDDYIKESQKSVDELYKDLQTRKPLKSDFPDDESFNESVAIFDARTSARIREYKDDISLVKGFLAKFRPGMAVLHEGIPGKFVGYKILDTGTKFKYTKGSIEFQFCFLSKFPILHLKLSSTLEELTMISQSILYFNYDEISKKVQEWKPNLDRRQIRRFLTGNILSGVVEAQSKKDKDEIKSWALQRFTNIDGSINTAIELKYSVDLSDNAEIFKSYTTLSVTSDNNNMLDYIIQMPFSTGSEFNISNGYVRGQNIYPIWNLENPKITDRAIAIIHREFGVENIVQFEIIQFLKKSVDKATGRKLLKDIKNGEKLYNELFYDDIFHQKFKNFFLNEQQKSITYAFKSTNVNEKNEDDEKGTGLYYDKIGKVKLYEFNLNDSQNIKYFLDELYKGYDISFNFRSDIADFYNIDVRPDIFDPKSKEQKVEKQYPDGEYSYRFIRQVNQNIIDSIPNVIRRTYEGAYGGVVTKQPIEPTMLPSYDLKPVNIPYDVLVKLTTSVLKDEDKIEFTKGLLDIQGESDLNIGNFIRKFITEKSVGTIYFFGDLRIPDYGKIFKEYSLNKELKDIVFEQEEIENIVITPPKSEITFDDAENFIIKLWSLI